MVQKPWRILGYVPELNRDLWKQPIIFAPDWSVGDLPQMQKFMIGWKTYNELFAKLVISKDDAQFEKNYTEIIKFLETNGFDDAGLKSFNDAWLEQNADFKATLLK